jgi:hypothetical protein
MEKNISEHIKKMSDVELDFFVRERLKFPRHELTADTDSNGRLIHKRFDMSGYGDCGSCQIHNTSIINLFSDCGIYDKIKFFYLDSYKGDMDLIYQGWDNDEVLRVNFSGFGTVEIIKEILKILVINCNFKTRRS